MRMTEMEMAVTLGILPEPEQNVVAMDPILKAELCYLSHIFEIARDQRSVIGAANPELWVELLPWHSMN